MSLLLKFDPDGGNLGRGTKVTALELAIIVPHIANILQALYNSNNHIYSEQYLPAKYGFEVYTGDRKFLELAINDIKLPRDVKWYEVDGRKIFDMRSASGGIVSSLICYLITS
jgi:hypothetical protein